MRRLFLFSVSTFVFSVSFSQKNEFLLIRPLLSSIDSIEKANNGEIFHTSFTISVSKDYFPNADKFHLANPLIFFRKGKIFNTEMNYYFSLPDSAIRLVSYSWNGSQKLTEDLNYLFETNASYFSKYFGQGGEIKNETHETWTQKTIIWENTIVHVKQFMVLGQGTYRVRVLISWK